MNGNIYDPNTQIPLVDTDPDSSMESNGRTVSARAREAWNLLEVGDKTTRRELGDLADLEEEERGGVSAMLSRLVQYGIAEKISDKPIVYEKKKDFNCRTRVPSKPSTAKTPSTKPPEEPTKDLDSVRIGNSIISVIEALKGKVKELSGEIRQLVEEKADVERCYRKAQERIQELNNQCQSGRKSINLAELQETINGAMGKEGRR